MIENQKFYFISYSQKAFTLIELSIVLVIIGLITGGILLGQDLIKTAETRSQITQIEQFNTAVNSFRIKYDCLPGDCLNAVKFGFLARTFGVGDGDGNGLIEGCYSYSDRFGCETALFWSDLGKANLIAGNFFSLTDGYNAITATSNLLPKAKLGKNYIAVITISILANYFYLGGITATDVNYDYVASSALSPAQAYAMDSKTDDGQPQNGKIVTVMASSGIQNYTTYGSSECAISATQYNVLSSNSSALLCQVAFQFR